MLFVNILGYIHSKDRNMKQFYLVVSLRVLLCTETGALWGSIGQIRNGQNQGSRYTWTRKRSGINTTIADGGLRQSILSTN